MRPITPSLVATSLLAATAITAPLAGATTVSYAPDGALLVTAAPGERNGLSLQTEYSGPRLVVYEGAASTGSATLVPGPGCEVQGTTAVVCPWTPSAGVRVDLGDGDDRAALSSELPPGAAITLAGGDGVDDLQASYDSGPVTLDGGAGNDKLVGGPAADTIAGGDGADALDGKGGADHLSGGAGDDTFTGDGTKSPAGDVIDGGPGVDKMQSDWMDSSVDDFPPVSVTLGGGADDGREGEGDDIRNVEGVTIVAGGSLTGTGVAERLENFQTYLPSRISGAGGNDVLKGGDGSDRIDGGAGDDDIDGGFGDDVIVGGAGRDLVSADRRNGDCGPLWCTFPYGNDTIDVRDGQRDSVTCGPGRDSVKADRIDVVSPDCERVRRTRR
jgi:Ca2+-binding RTX toxin-like protein